MESFLLFAAAAGGYAGLPAPDQPPEAAFVVRDGWLNVRLTDAGRPVSGATVRCLVGTHQWAEGETGSDGDGAFPAPKAGTCQMVFDLGAGPSAPIPLTFLTADSIVPTSCAVRDGSRDCCRPVRLTPVGDTPAAPAPPTVWPLAVAGLVLGTVLSAAALWLLRRTMRSRTPNHTRRASDARK